MQRTIRRRDLAVSSMSHLAVVDGERVTDEDFLRDVVEGKYSHGVNNAGLFDPALVIRDIRPDQIRLCEQCTGKSVIWEDRSLGGAELHQLIQLRIAFVKKFNERWQTYRSVEMRRLRKECTTTKVRYGFREEPRTRTVSWSYTIRVLREDLLKLPYAVWPGMPPADVPRALDSYKPSNAAKLALGTGKDVVAIRVQRSKVIHYVAHVRYIRGTKTWLNRHRLRTMIADWMRDHPRPPASRELEYLRLTEQIRALQRKMAGEWKRCANINTAGFVDARPLISAVRAAYAPYTALSPNRYPWGRLSEEISDANLTAWRGALDALRENPGILIKGETERDTFAQVYFSPKVFNTSSHGFSESRKGSGGEILQGVNFPVIQDELGTNRYDRARLALENGQLDGDDLDKADFNAFRSAAELKDLGQTWKQAKDFVQWLKATRHGKLLRATTTMRGAASAYLAQLFAVQPTIDDVNTLLKHTRAELLGVRRGLWKLASALNLFSARAVTLRKYAARKFNVPRRPRRGTPDYGPYLLTDTFREEFPESWSVIRSTSTRSEWIDHLEPLDGGWRSLNLDMSLPNVSARDGLGRPTCWLWEPEEFQSAITRVEPSLLPHWYFGDERAVLFASFRPEEILKALDPSRIENLAETMKIAKNAWELYPLSFVVDWLMTTGDVAKDIQNLLGSVSSGLFSDSGVWCSLPRNLYAVVPRYQVTQTLTCLDFRFRELGPRPGWDSSLPWWVAYGPSTCSICTEFALDAVEVYRTDVRQFARGPMVAAMADPLRALRLLAPRFRVNLGTGQLSTLLAMLISSC